jgi:hypothetical protein
MSSFGLSTTCRPVTWSEASCEGPGPGGRLDASGWQAGRHLAEVVDPDAADRRLEPHWNA